MQTNPNNPYDEVFGNLSKIVEEIVRRCLRTQNAASQIEDVTNLACPRRTALYRGVK